VSAGPLTIAIPKGRVSKVLAPLFKAAGLDTSALGDDDRTLVRSSADGSLRFLLRQLFAGFRSRAINQSFGRLRA